MPYYVYLLLSTDGATYVGATVDLDRRLRQHNKELAGGAVRTSIKIKQGELWRRAMHVAGFPDWKAALQFEWRWKHLSRQNAVLAAGKTPLERRIVALKSLLSLERPTSKAQLYSEWTAPPQIITDFDDIHGDFAPILSPFVLEFAIKE